LYKDKYKPLFHFVNNRPGEAVFNKARPKTSKAKFESLDETQYIAGAAAGGKPHSVSF